MLSTYRADALPLLHPLVPAERGVFRIPPWRSRDEIGGRRRKIEEGEREGRGIYERSRITGIILAAKGLNRTLAWINNVQGGMGWVRRFTSTCSFHVGRAGLSAHRCPPFPFHRRSWVRDTKGWERRRAIFRFL